MIRGGTSCKPHDGSSGKLIPGWGSQPRQCRHKINPIIMFYGRGHPFRFSRIHQKSQRIASALNHGSSDKHTPVQRIGYVTPSLPANLAEGLLPAVTTVF